ncbi:TetR/AcrR family transcriptional regulator [Kitasatospora aureofaciens]|uniref:TetR/AcrR family transcriptional regulator n=1 Tax=Kitasatospora aureofaciens TaxID=1894 RepID=UPI001C43CFA2|nr:TetR/AcrR family transcriptional regulator [Kitasatospora aureofaciens]MBV6699723.1 TetR/AcrR family transcriptional regulator [Kitasatospora aureofaciens]
MGTDRLDEVLDATYDCLTRYGVRRTTMDDIATTMGVSRSAVYQYVRSKDDAFRRLAGRLHEQALARARRAAADTGVPYAARVRGVLAAKLELVLALSEDSPHTAELLDDKARLFGGICSAFTDDLRRLLTALFDEAGTVEGVEPVEAADVCIALVVGLENVADAHRLLPLGSDALVAGYLGAPVSTVPVSTVTAGS